MEARLGEKSIAHLMMKSVRVLSFEKNAP